MIKAVNERKVDNQEVDSYKKAKYITKTIIPYVENPVEKTYLLTQEELNNFLDGYSEYGEFIISVIPQIQE